MGPFGRLRANYNLSAMLSLFLFIVHFWSLILDSRVGGWSSPPTGWFESYFPCSSRPVSSIRMVALVPPPYAHHAICLPCIYLSQSIWWSADGKHREWALVGEWVTTTTKIWNYDETVASQYLRPHNGTHVLSDHANNGPIGGSTQQKLNFWISYYHPKLWPFGALLFD
jgi:hypothetical protein